MTDSRAAEPRTGRPSTDSPRSDQPDQPAIKSGAGMLAAAPKEPATQDIGVPIRPFQSNLPLPPGRSRSPTWAVRHAPRWRPTW